MYFIVPAVLISVATIAVAFSIPQTFQAKATILIESQRIPNELASTTVTANSTERLKVIEQRLLARKNLLAIAEKFSLYRDNDGSAPPATDIVDAMRDDIIIEQLGVSQSRRNTQIIGFDVAFQYTDATIAARVTNELVNSILAQNLETRINRAAETSDFFVQELQNFEQELTKLEERMAAFKRENEGTLPETLEERRASLTQAKLELSLIDQQLRAVQGPNGADALLDPGTQQLAFRLESRELTYKSYLDRREQLTPLFSKGFVSKRTMDDLERQIALSEIEIASIKSQMAQEGVSADPEARLKLLELQSEELQTRVDNLQEGIQRTPAVEFRMAAMVREYENLRAEYNQTKAKLTDAQIGERLEQDRQAERFEVLEQATIPEDPSAPNRTQIVAAGGGGAVMVGAALVLLLEFLDNSIRSARDLERRLQLRPIAVIPYVTTRQERVRKIARRLLTFFLVLLGIVSVMAVVHLYIVPLDLLAERVWLKIEPILPGFLKP